jgi:hypothetical protein
MPGTPGFRRYYTYGKPTHGIVYFVSGACGELSKGDLHRSADTAAAFDQDRSFLLNVVSGDDLYLSLLSHTGATVRHRTIHREDRQ